MRSLLIRLILFLPAVASFSLLLLCYNSTYSDFITHIKNIHPEVYDADNFHLYSKENGFQNFKIALLFLTASMLLLGIIGVTNIPLVENIIRSLKENLQKIFSAIANVTDQLSGIQKAFVSAILLLAISHKVWLLSVVSLSDDEIFTYIFFIKQEFYICAIYYPEPNNHIFFNLIVQFFDVFISDPKWCMRLPSLLFFIGSIVLLFVYSMKRLGFLASIISLVICSFSIPTSFYSIQGRGYMALSFFALLSIISLLQHIKHTDDKTYLFIFILSSILGAYTIPVFLFPFTGILLFGLIASKGSRRSLLYSTVLIGGAVCLLYLPIITLNGIDALLGNKWVRAKEFALIVKILPIAASESFDFLIGLNRRSYVVLLVLLCLTIYLWESGRLSTFEKRWFYLLIIFAGSALFIILLTRNFPPYRVWTYLVFPLAVGISILLTKLISALFTRQLIIHLIETFFLIVYPLLMFLKLESDLDKISFVKEIDHEINLITSSMPQTIFIDQHDRIEFGLRLNLILNDTKADIDMGIPEKNKCYDYLIIDKERVNRYDLKNFEKMALIDHWFVYKNTIHD